MEKKETARERAQREFYENERKQQEEKAFKSNPANLRNLKSKDDRDELRNLMIEKVHARLEEKLGPTDMSKAHYCC